MGERGVVSSFSFAQHGVRPDLATGTTKKINCSIYNKMKTEWMIPVSLRILEALKNFFFYRFIFFPSLRAFLYVILNFSYGVCGNQTVASSIP